MFRRLIGKRRRLIAQLKDKGIKHSPENILQIEKIEDLNKIEELNRILGNTPDQKIDIVFLERGNDEAGFQHILTEKRKKNFAERGISEDEIPELLITASTKGKIIGTQGRRGDRIVYEVEFNGTTQYVSVSVANNGYIVGANPTPSNLIRRLTQEQSL